MPLDPEIGAILKGLESAPPMESLPVDALRASLAYPPLERRTAVGESVDLAISLPGRVLPARLYRPLDVRSRGVTVFFHGGGFVIGNLDTHDQFAAIYARAAVPPSSRSTTVWRPSIGSRLRLTTALPQCVGWNSMPMSYRSIRHAWSWRATVPAAISPR